MYNISYYLFFFNYCSEHIVTQARIGFALAIQKDSVKYNHMAKDDHAFGRGNAATQEEAKEEEEYKESEMKLMP